MTMIMMKIMITIMIRFNYHQQYFFWTCSLSACGFQPISWCDVTDVGLAYIALGKDRRAFHLNATFTIIVRRVVSAGSRIVWTYRYPSPGLLHGDDNRCGHHRNLLCPGNPSWRSIDQGNSRWGTRGASRHDPGRLPGSHSVRARSLSFINYERLIRKSYLRDTKDVIFLKDEEKNKRRMQRFSRVITLFSAHFYSRIRTWC